MDNDISDRVNHYINTHPRECLFTVFIVAALILQVVPLLLGIVIFLLFLRKNKLYPLLVLTVGAVLLVIEITLRQKSFNGYALIQALFLHNKILFQHLFSSDFKSVLNDLQQQRISLTFIFAGILGLIDLIPQPPHAKALKALQEGVLVEDNSELSDKMIDELLKKTPKYANHHIILGVSKYNGSVVKIPEKYVNQVLLVLGTTGSGKTITLRRFYEYAISQNHPLIIVDGKPDEGNINWLTNLAEKYQRSFNGFNCGNYKHYDCLSNGGYTELKDKIISLKDKWENDYYRSIAEDYLQTTFEVLLKSNESIDLKKIVTCLNYDELLELTRSVKNEELSKRVTSLEQYNRQDITGLQAHLNLLVHSELGQYFLQNEDAFRLQDVINNNGIVYFALPALRFPSFSKVLGKLVINDLKAVVDRINNPQKKIFTIFDEFSVFAGEQVLNLVNMGRGKGIHAVFGTQGLADLDKIDISFKKQVLNCVNTLICHRLNDKESAEDVANWIATKKAFTITSQLNLEKSGAGMGSVRVNKEFIVHPDCIKQELRTGEAFYASKVERFRVEKVKIKF